MKTNSNLTKHMNHFHLSEQNISCCFKCNLYFILYTGHNINNTEGAMNNIDYLLTIDNLLEVGKMGKLKDLSHFDKGQTVMAI